ncbi:calpain-like cysteine peptidase [Trypanosoma grayi]|uniref:calpain-like cysteine peptidase n=1 Tax=Trypanosoma grayi TaxID=71804 RepID=UPI0004F4B083|nr:calpain-like cysteine peptidase [Trypanosoma grayi]KEG10837.1 calpain-like cysteine peptidase [Trypanosoma grayi]
MSSFFGSAPNIGSTVGGTSMYATLDEFDEGSVVNHRDDLSYNFGRPAFEGEVTACYDDGILFRIVEGGRPKRWSFYNDTPNCQIQVEVIFGPGSQISALGNTVMEKNEKDLDVCKVTVYPLETELFIEGEPNGYSCEFVANELADDYLEDLVAQDRDVIQQETYDVYQLVGENASTDDTVKACVARKVKFVDFAFPPEQESLQIGSIMQMKMVPFERPSMYLSDENAKQARLFRNGIHPFNIDEGDLGDSWFVGAVACMAEYPDRVRDLFRHPVSLDEGKREREVGAYRVTFNKNGWWTNVIIDDYLPCAGGRPKFARTKGDPLELWISILEKAYAKIHGGYGFIIAGDPLHALQDITGYPCSSFNNALNEAALGEGGELFEHLMHYSDFGYQAMMVTPTREVLGEGSNGLDEDAYHNAKLQLGHVYAVLRVVYFPEHNLRLLQFRDPWTRECGDERDLLWRKGDSKWDQYPEVSATCGYHEVDDGTFYLEWAEALMYFTGCGVCFIQHPMYDFRIRAHFMHNVPTTCLEISVGMPVVLCIMLSQDDKRGMDKAEYSPIMISIAHGCGAVSPMRVDLNSGFDTDHPNPDYTFFESRETSMFYEFLPEHSPYLVVPRAMSMYPDLPYVLGVRSPVEVGTPSSHVRVAFRSLDPGCRIFDNVRHFESLTVPCEAEFQALSPEQFFPDIYVGTVIQVD